MPSSQSTTAYARPGDVVHFQCDHCAEIYRQTVQPRRDVSRALKRLDEGNVERARELLEEAHAELQGIASFMNEINHV